MHNVMYSDLVDKTEEVCRGLCEFLRIEFDSKMLDLSTADFSAIHLAPHHEHLRRGLIERREFPKEAVDARIVGLLQRFQARWIRLRSECFGTERGPSTHTEPTLAERGYYKLTGKFLWTTHTVKRALLEFLPLPWLGTYRELKVWFFARRPTAPSTRFHARAPFSENSVTVLTSYAILAIVAGCDSLTGPDLTLAPFYVIPCALLATVINWRWGSCAAVIAAGIWSVIQNLGHNHTMDSVLLWNSVMRFVVLETFVLLLSRIRLETVSESRST